MTPPLESSACQVSPPCPYVAEIAEMKTDLAWIKKIGATIVGLVIANLGLLIKVFLGK